MHAMRLSALFVIAAAAILTAPQPTFADCGSIPFYAPVLDSVDVVVSSDTEAKGLRVDPLKVSVFEPKQRAIILWNGDEEILLLSTDQRATQKSAVLEVIPLPAEPKVRLGSFKTFEAAQKLVREHPDVGAIVFECTNMAPYAHLVQQAVSLPVFDIQTLTNMVFEGTHRAPYSSFA